PGSTCHALGSAPGPRHSQVRAGEPARSLSEVHVMRFAVTLSLVLVGCGFVPAQDTRAVIIQTPAKNDTVAKKDDVKGICAVKGAIPVVFVKPLEGTDWYVQEPTTQDGAKFKCNAHFGEAESNGKFKIVVVAVPKEKVKEFSEGDKIATLPDYPASDPV